MIILIYILPIILIWKYINLAFSKGGIYEAWNINLIDLILMFIPIGNIGVLIGYWSDGHPIKEENKLFNINKFFNIKK